MPRITRVGCFVLTTLVMGSVARTSLAEPPSSSVAPAAPGVAPAAPGATTAAPSTSATGQGIAVLGIGSTSRDEAFALARAIYGSRLRPSSLDEIRARVLAGAPPPANGSRALKELAELRAGVTGEDAVGRRLLSGLAQQVGAQALLVVKVERAAAPPSPPPANEPPSWPSFSPPSPSTEPGNAAPPSAAGADTVVARLFLVETGEFDAARYFPDAGASGPDAWKSTVTSLEGRFPAAARVAAPPAATQGAPNVLSSESQKSQAFYASGWFWGALGAAALIGGAFYFASRGDTGSDPIHLQMRVPK